LPALVAGQTAEIDVVRGELEVRTRERVAKLESAEEVATLYRETVVPLDAVSYESARAG
jgi:hypothetical protein